MKNILLIVCFSSLIKQASAQICGTPGLDGPENISASINTYFPPAGNITLAAGAKTISLAAVPPNDLYGNNFGTEPIKAGDLLLIIQMQDASINFTNNNFYGANNSSSGPDALGGTGYTNIGNSGRFEYVIATNTVALSGGNLTFKGAGTGTGTIHTYVNAAATQTSGKKTFEVVRVPQYSNLVLSSNISTPPFNGKAGGIVAFDVSGNMDFNGYTIDASFKGFRGGYGIIANSGPNINSVYVVPSTDDRSVGKGEGIAGTPRYMWDGFNQVDNIDEGLPGGSYGKGAPANAGGGGNDHNSGGGGGGNGGEGGVGGDGVAALGTGPGSYPNGGRPGSITYTSGAPDITRLMMGGGGGGGDANNALTGVKGGVGGGIILINVETIKGTGTILANGGTGAPGIAGSRPDGAGGGGAGGSVFIKVSKPDLLTVLTIEAKGGNGGNTENDQNDEHGPGGGGGGGQVFYAISSGTVNVNSIAGNAGRSNSGAGITHNATNGKTGNSKPFILSDLPAYLQGGGSICYPQLTTILYEASPLVKKYPGSELIYTVKTTNASGGGNAGGVQIELQIPAGLTIKSGIVTYTGNAGGPLTITNTGTPTHLFFGDFNISPGDTVIVTLTLQVDCNTAPGSFNSSAQAVYLDPTRTSLDRKRKITGFINAFAGTNTVYETGLAGQVPGSNYNGNLASSSAEDLTVIAATALTNNAVNISQTPVVFCVTGDPAVITGSTPAGGTQTYTYQWQSSTDNIVFTDIIGSILKDFDPPVLNDTIYYHRVVSSLSCLTPIISNVISFTVNYKPVVAFLLPDICLKDGAALFTNQTTIDDGSTAGLQYLWNFGDPGSTQNTSVLKDASHTYTAVGNYAVVLTVTSGACIVPVTKPFTVNGSVPKANFSIINAATLCSSQPVIFVDNATVDFGEITKIEWYYDFGNNASAVKIDDEPEKRNAAPRNYTNNYPLFNTPPTKDILVRMIAYSGLTCVDEKTIPLILKAIPEVAFSVINPVCSNAPAFQLTQAKEIYGVLSGSGVYTGVGVVQNIFNPAIADSGIYPISYTFNADNGCSDFKTQTITVYPAPTVTGGNAEVLERGEIKLPATATGTGLSYLWTPSTALSSNNVLNPTASPVKDITYTIKVTNTAGCSATNQVVVKVFMNPVIPNAFSPNGDGINDLWNIQNLNTYPNAAVNVFNRYGQKVFTSVGYSTPWNGKYNGKDLPLATYYYVIDTKKGHRPFSGSVTILK